MLNPKAAPGLGDMYERNRDPGLIREARNDRVQARFDELCRDPDMITEGITERAAFDSAILKTVAADIYHDGDPCFIGKRLTQDVIGYLYERAEEQVA